jgi:hypothetical protein
MFTANIGSAETKCSGSSIASAVCQGSYNTMHLLHLMLLSHPDMSGCCCQLNIQTQASSDLACQQQGIGSADSISCSHFTAWSTAVQLPLLASLLPTSTSPRLPC